MPAKTFIRSRYLHQCLSPRQLRRTVREVVTALRPHKHEFDAIAFRGLSGSLVAPSVALRLHKPLIAVRKPPEQQQQSHSEYMVEGAVQTQCYVIVDDIICTGQTVESIVLAIREVAINRDICLGGDGSVVPTCWGVVCFNETSDYNDCLPDCVRSLGINRKICTRA